MPKTFLSKLSSGRAPLVALAVIVAALLFSAPAQMQSAKKPITRKGLIESVKINGLSTAELVQIIQRRGVDFEMTADAEQELRSVGARPEIIETARANYRAPEVVAARPSSTLHTSNTPAPSRNSTGQPVPPGPPLAKNEIITMLQAGTPSARVERFVEVRGVTFSLTPDITGEIKAAGGDRSLIGAITEKSTQVAATTDSPFGNHTTPVNNAPDYDDYTDRAQSAISAGDLNSAISYTQQAVQMDSSQPRAYQMLGTLLLYGRNDMSGAEQAMRAAIERGGSAVFHVYHDHENGTFSQYCEGSFFVTKTGVSFKANDGRDTFETLDSNIKEAKTNGWFGSALGAFHIKPVQAINSRGNFNFAPGSRNKAEAELIIRLIQAY
jgi:hypothetical protein